MRQIRIAMLVAVAGLALAGTAAGTASAAMKVLALSTSKGPLNSGAHTEWTVTSLSLTGKSGVVSCPRVEPPWKDIVEEPIKEGGSWTFTLSSGSTSSVCTLNEELVEVTPEGFPLTMGVKKTTVKGKKTKIRVEGAIEQRIRDCGYAAEPPKGGFEVGAQGSPVPFLPTFTNQKLKLEGKTPGCEKNLLMNMSFEVSSEGEPVLVQWKETSHHPH